MGRHYTRTRYPIRDGAKPEIEETGRNTRVAALAAAGKAAPRMKAAFRLAHFRHDRRDAAITSLTYLISNLKFQRTC